MFDLSKFLNDGKHRVQSVQYVDNLAIKSANYPARQMMHRTLREHLAEFLAKEKVNETIEDNVTRFSVDLLVFTPDEFMHLIREAAQDYALTQLRY